MQSNFKSKKYNYQRKYADLLLCKECSTLTLPFLRAFPVVFIGKFDQKVFYFQQSNQKWNGKSFWKLTLVIKMIIVGNFHCKLFHSVMYSNLKTIKGSCKKNPVCDCFGYVASSLCDVSELWYKFQS